MTAEFFVPYACPLDRDHVHTPLCKQRPPLLLAITEHDEVVERHRADLENDFQGYRIERVWLARDVEGMRLVDWDRAVILGTAPPSSDFLRALLRSSNKSKRAAAPRGKRMVDQVQWRLTPISRKARP